MDNPIIDFFIGLTLVNVVPHYMMGILKIRFLSLYGFGDMQNIAYALTSTLASILLFHLNYGLGTILDHAWYVGGMFIIVSYLLLGRFLVNKFEHKE